LLDRQFDGLHTAVNAQFVESVRDMEFDRAETHDKPFGDLVVIEPLHDAFEHIAFQFRELLAGSFISER
jgi:hypothetical protein